MLVLSRKRDESIMIRDDIVVTIIDIRGDKVRIGIEASKDIPVHRLEVYKAIQCGKLAAPVHNVGDDSGSGHPIPDSTMPELPSQAAT